MPSKSSVIVSIHTHIREKMFSFLRGKQTLKIKLPIDKGNTIALSSARVFKEYLIIVSRSLII